MSLSFKIKSFVTLALLPFLFIAKSPILGFLFFIAKYLSIGNLFLTLRFSLPRHLLLLVTLFFFLCVFSVVNVFFKDAGIVSFAYLLMFGMAICLPIFLSRATIHWTAQQWRDIFGFVLIFFTCINLLSLISIALGLEFSTDIRYNPYGPSTISNRGIYYTTNYGTLFSAIGLILGLIFYLSDNKNYKYFIIVMINLLAMFMFQSRAQTILALFVSGLLTFSFNKRLLVAILTMMALAIYMYLDLIVEVLKLFMRYESLLERGLLGNRGLMYDVVFSSSDSIGLTGLGAGNSRSVWTIVDASKTSLSSVDLGNMEGLNLHSSVLTLFTEYGLLGPLIFYFLPFFVLAKTRKIKSKWVPEFRYLLLFCILDSFINDDFSSLASPGQPLLILTLGFLYGHVQKVKPKGKPRYPT